VQASVAYDPLAISLQLHLIALAPSGGPAARLATARPSFAHPPRPARGPAGAPPPPPAATVRLALSMQARGPSHHASLQLKCPLSTGEGTRRVRLITGDQTRSGLGPCVGRPPAQRAQPRPRPPLADPGRAICPPARLCRAPARAARRPLRPRPHALRRRAARPRARRRRAAVRHRRVPARRRGRRPPPRRAAPPPPPLGALALRPRRRPPRARRARSARRLGRRGAAGRARHAPGARRGVGPRRRARGAARRRARCGGGRSVRAPARGITALAPGLPFCARTPPPRRPCLCELRGCVVR
jgi:hypothetical protein